MAPTASVSELQGLADQKLNELSAQIDQRNSELQALETRKKNLDDSVHQLESRQATVREELASLGEQVEQATTTLSATQQKNLDRLAKAEADADAAQKKAEQAQRALEDTQRSIHQLREQARAVIADALEDANEALTDTTKRHQDYTAKLDGLLALVTTKDDTSTP